MAHGENVRPLESTEGNPVEVNKDSGEASVQDASAAHTLGEILLTLQQILFVLQARED